LVLPPQVLFYNVIDEIIGDIDNVK
jgi:hypothetical protein